jgi:hypothetical protein
MTIAKPISRPLLVGLLILIALAVYAAMSVSVSLAPSRPSITFPQNTQAQPRGNAGSAHDQATQSSQSAQSSQSSVDVGQPSGSGTPVENVGRPGPVIGRFADAGPDVVGPATSETYQSCPGPKPCPRPQR